MGFPFDVVIKFGKYKGHLVRDIPTDYLEWVVDKCDDDPRLRLAIKSELSARSIYGSNTGSSSSSQREYYHSDPPAPKSGLPVAVDAQIVIEIIRAGRKTLAQRYHPDVGGDSEIMTRVNASADYLEQKAASLLGTGGVS